VTLPVLQNKNSTADVNQTLVRLNNVNVFLGNKPVLRNINWTLKKGERWLLKGHNGAGKTTLVKTLLAEIRPSVDSEIWRYGFSERASVWEIRKLIGYVSPELQQSYQYNISVTESVASGFFSSIGLYDKVSRQQQLRVETLLSRFELLDLADQGVHQISSGQMRRVLIARAMVVDPEIMIFDEITANLDTLTRQKILETIAGLAGPDNSMIFVSHNHSEIRGLYNRVLEIESGKMIATSTLVD
jgi:ABC-type molybdenum transport system ATPase subunit/photorepair protein PhrA